MKYEIMVSILFDLLSKKTVTAKYLAEKYEVSVRSIYRYIDSLSSAGVPLYSNKGNGGGFSIIDTYKFSSTFLTPTEFEQTINSLLAITEGVPNKTLENVITKLKSTVRNEYNDIDLKSGNLVIDAGPWGDMIGYKNKLKVIQKSIDSLSPLSIRYHDRNGSITERVIEPHVIVFKQGLWYVFAYCRLRKEFRLFKIGRIEYANINDEKFERKDISSEDLPLNFWNRDTVAETVIMEIDKKFVSDIEEWLGIENVTLKNDKYIAEAKLPYDGGLFSKIMSYGSGIKVIEPKKLKDDIIKSANEVLDIYK